VARSPRPSSSTSVPTTTAFSKSQVFLGAMAATKFFVLVLGMTLGSCFASTAGSFRGVRADGVGRTIAVQEVELSIRDTMEAVLQGDGAASKQLGTIEGRIWQTFQALPKNDMGRLGPRAVRYLVHNYFVKEHGWLIQGLEPHGNQAEVSEIHEVNILQDKAPALVESLLEARRANHGLSLADAVSMIATLERLIFDESLALLQASYTLNGFTPVESLEENSMHEVLTSYLLLFQLGHKGNLSDARLHRALKNKVSKRDDWETLVEFEADAVYNYGFANRHQSNPFVEQRFTFQDSTEIVEGLAHSYGKWQNMECRQMKEDLMELDADGSGSIPLNRFYGQQDNSKYQFTESTEYLRKIGALDEQSSQAKVRIANYLQGPSNCIASSTYYSVCCLSECELLLNEIEGKVQSPTVEPERLLHLVGNMSSSSVDAPWQLPNVMEQRLKDIASHHDGEVPLHGRLLGEWLHYAFPNECPYPHIAEEATALTPSHWLDKSASIDKEQRKTLAEVTTEADQTEEAPITWSHEEVLHAHEIPMARGLLSSMLRVVMQVVMLLGLLRMALGSWQLASDVRKEKKTACCELPF